MLNIKLDCFLMKTGRDGYSHSYLGLDTKLLILTVSLTMIGHGQACLNTGTHGLLGLKPPPNQSKRGGQGGREVSGLGDCLRQGHMGPTKAI